MLPAQQTPLPSALVGIPHENSSTEAEHLLRGAGFRVRQVLARTIVDCQASAEDVHRARLASSFGNYLCGLDEQEQKQVRAAFDRELERLRAREQSVPGAPKATTTPLAAQEWIRRISTALREALASMPSPNDRFWANREQAHADLAVAVCARHSEA